MTIVTDKNFLDRLYSVISKLSKIVSTQTFRYQKIWNSYFSTLDIKPHIVRQIPLEEEKFHADIDYRIATIKTVSDSFIDGFYSIKSILQALYKHYFISSELFKKDFSTEDQIILKYFAAREILGNLVQYNKMDHETVPLKYTIIAREYLMIKLKGVKLSDIDFSLKKLNKNIAKESIIKIMEEIKEDGIINIEKDGDSYLYTLNKELKLSEEGKNTYNQTLRPLIEWPTQFFRSFYNIRELNLTPSKECAFSDFLTKVLAKSATQGYSPAQYVFSNLVKYFEKIKEKG